MCDYVDLEQSGIMCALYIGERSGNKEQHASGLEMVIGNVS